jgi:16S rRNA (uracil1498-N3)-methyltransferase
MSRKCFYVGPFEDGAGMLTLRGETAHHVNRVLRLGVGEGVELRDGAGRSWLARIHEVSGSAVQVRIIEELHVNAEAAIHLTLGMALARSDRMDQVVRQGTEVGIHRFAFFPAARSQYRLGGEDVGRRRARWLKIAREAMCQCRRTVLPEVFILDGVGAFIEETRFSGAREKECLKVLTVEGRLERSLMDLYREFPHCDELVAVIGPEGGWTESEVSRFEGEGFMSVHLGPRIMRFETAAMAAMIGAQLLWGDLS